jgi:hypothetical protein
MDDNKSSKRYDRERTKRNNRHDCKDDGRETGPVSVMSPAEPGLLPVPVCVFMYETDCCCIRRDEKVDKKRQGQETETELKTRKQQARDGTGFAGVGADRTRGGTGVCVCICA